MAEIFFLPRLGDVNLVPTWAHAGAPSNGTSGTLANVAGVGDLLIDTTNAVCYQNTGTTASPTWTHIVATGSTAAITSGTINGATIGATTPSTGAFTTVSATGQVTSTVSTGTAPFVVASTTNVANLNASSLGGATFAAPGAIGGTTPAAVTTNALHVDTGTKTATASSGAATLNKMAGVITSESLTTAAGADYTLTLTNSDIAATDQVFASVALGSAATGTPAVATVAPGTTSVVIVIQNIHATAAFTGTLLISFLVVKN